LFKKTEGKRINIAYLQLLINNYKNNFKINKLIILKIIKVIILMINKKFVKYFYILSIIKIFIFQNKSYIIFINTKKIKSIKDIYFFEKNIKRFNFSLK